MERKRRKQGGSSKFSEQDKSARVKKSRSGKPKSSNGWFSLFAVVGVIVGVLVYLAFQNRRREISDATAPTAASIFAANYVGAATCKSCHEAAYNAWGGSQHERAMQDANEVSVLGNFDNAKFTYAGITSTFFQRDGKLFVNTDGPDGKLRDYEIKYTFGVMPLQQYLIEFSHGRIQALSIAWDARPKQAGGQRWFHLYPQERITHDDELHWTRPPQNWNFMCADCHSTNLRKNYDLAADRFQTEWSEISVGCEACHGPGSRHVEWAKAKEGGKSSADESKGLTVRLDERRGVTWNPLAASGNAARSRPRAREREIEVCAQCHARRGQIAEGYMPGKPFLDYYRPALLTSPLYYADGQQRDEVYIWGSFLQSKMYARGVTCSDCHNPHSGKLRAERNSVCASCHLASKYDTSAHHHHKIGSKGALCAECHMPTTTYMVVDPRHDHSLRVPRPDLSVKLGTPNACNGCHSDRDARWAAAQVVQWYGRNPQGYQHFAAAFAAANAGTLDAQAQLREIATDTTRPAVARATAVAGLSVPLGKPALDTLTASVRDRNPLLRLAAIQSLNGAPPDVRVRLAAPLLSDSLRAIRIEAASVLAAVPAEQLSAEQRTPFARASAEYIASQQYNADRAEARVNLGTFYANRGDAAKAEREFKASLRLNPQFIPAYVNLVDLYRARGRDQEGERVLRDGLRIAPKSAMLHHALGLALVRLKRSDAALGELELATVLDSGNVRFAYVYAVALHSTGKAEAAITRLKKALAASPNDRDILAALASFYAVRGESGEAEKYADRLRTLTDK
jgi:Tfp pilus assembly protein PilF